uniref:Uncharacterized protein n=1 Tax=Magnetospirillum gryphiswaldense TaxID=55518 RepID=A4TUL3_9PROT|nr:hypothetical protein MGR_2936 [Magnetospirillum gryphiswaldense MSR-1]
MLLVSLVQKVCDSHGQVKALGDRGARKQVEDGISAGWAAGVLARSGRGRIVYPMLAVGEARRRPKSDRVVGESEPPFDCGLTM